MFNIIRDPAPVKTQQLEVQRLFHDLGIERARGIGKHADMTRQEVVDLHVPQSDEAVEPCIGDLLHDLRVTFGLDLQHQLMSLLLFLRREHLPVHGDGAFLAEALSRNTVLIGALGDLLHQGSTRPDSKFLNSGFVHGKPP